MVPGASRSRRLPFLAGRAASAERTAPSDEAAEECPRACGHAAAAGDAGQQREAFGQPGAEHALQASGAQQRRGHLQHLAADACALHRAAQHGFVVVAAQHRRDARLFELFWRALVDERHRAWRHAGQHDADDRVSRQLVRPLRSAVPNHVVRCQRGRCSGCAPPAEPPPRRATGRGFGQPRACRVPRCSGTRPRRNATRSSPWDAARRELRDGRRDQVGGHGRAANGRPHAAGHLACAVADGLLGIVDLAEDAPTAVQIGLAAGGQGEPACRALEQALDEDVGREPGCLRR